MDFRTIKEEYASIYTSSPEVLCEEVDVIDEEYEAELDALVDSALLESVVLELLDEGLDADDIVEAYLELIEAKVTTGKGGRVSLSSDPEGPKVTSGSGSKMAAAKRLAGMKSAKKIANAKARKEKVKGAIQKVKDTAKAGVSKAKEAGREAKFQAVDKKVASYANKRKLDNAPGLKARSKDPEKRRGLRAKVAKDIGDRAKAKVARGAKKAGDAAVGAASSAKKGVQKKAASAAVSGYAAAKSAKDAVSDAKNKAKQSIKNRIAIAKRNVTGAVGKVARKVADKAGGVATKMGEETNYDLVLKYLYVEGYADSFEEAESLMVNFSHDDIQEILENS